MRSNPPPGWSELQKRARKATTSQELSAVIDEMNELLSAYEKAAGKEENLKASDDPDYPARKRQSPR